MKKLISVLLSVLMLFSAMSCVLVAFAEEPASQEEPVFLDITNYGSLCSCSNHHPTVDCKCCAFCPTTQKRMSCVHAVEVVEEPHIRAYACCGACTGWLGCVCGDSATCDCEACKAANQDGVEDYEGKTQLIDSDTQKTIIEVFQNVLSKISEVFDQLFDSLFEFLRMFGNWRRPTE